MEICANFVLDPPANERQKMIELDTCRTTRTAPKTPIKCEIEEAVLKVPLNEFLVDKTMECIKKFNSGDTSPTIMTNKETAGMVIAAINNMSDYGARDNSYTGSKGPASIVVWKADRSSDS